jgi:hypothetical protein
MKFSVKLIVYILLFHKNYFSINFQFANSFKSTDFSEKQLINFHENEMKI